MAEKLSMEAQQQMAVFDLGGMMKGLLPQFVKFLPAIIILATAKAKTPQQVKILLAISKAFESFGSKDETAVKQAWRAVRDAITNYIGE